MRAGCDRCERVLTGWHNQWCEKCPSNSIQTLTQTHTQTCIISRHGLYEGVFLVHVMMKVWRTTWCTTGIQLHNYWEIYETARRLRPILHEAAVCFTSPYTPLHSQHTHTALASSLLITAQAGMDSCCIACRLFPLSVALTAPYQISLLYPENHVENTVTVDCCTRNAPIRITNTKQRTS